MLPTDEEMLTQAKEFGSTLYTPGVLNERQLSYLVGARWMRSLAEAELAAKDAEIERLKVLCDTQHCTIEQRDSEIERLKVGRGEVNISNLKCPTCLNPMYEMPISSEPEGIRSDHWCDECQIMYASHKFGLVKRYKPVSSQRELEAEIERLKNGTIKTSNEIEQVLGKTLGYPKYADDPINFPHATESDGVCVGEHVAESIAIEAAKEIERLKSGQRELLKEYARWWWSGKAESMDFVASVDKFLASREKGESK